MRQPISQEFTNNPPCRFTLFVVLPWDQVCSLRHLPSGVTIKSLYQPLELMSGCPAKTYSLVTSHGRVLEDDLKLECFKNVWDGYVVKIKPLDEWVPVYDGVIKSDLDCIFGNKEVNDKDYTDDTDAIDIEDSHVVTPLDKYGGVALFLSCWCGQTQLVSKLLKAGVDPNWQTLFGRPSSFACVAKENETILNILLQLGTKSSLTDCFGETALSMAKRTQVRSCIKTIHAFHLRQIPNAPFDLSTSSNVSEITGVHSLNDDKQNNNNGRSTLLNENDIELHNQQWIESGGKDNCKLNSSDNKQTDGFESNDKNTQNKTNTNATLNISSESRKFSPRSATLHSGTRCTMFEKTSCHDPPLSTNFTKHYGNSRSSNVNYSKTTTHHQPHHVQTISTHRSLKYISEDGSFSESSPRSCPGFATLRISRWPGPGKTMSSQQRLITLGENDQPCSQDGKVGKTTLINIPHQTLTIDYRETSPESNWNYTQSTTPRYTSLSRHSHNRPQTNDNDIGRSESVLVSPSDKGNDIDEVNGDDAKDENPEKSIEKNSYTNKEEGVVSQNSEKKPRKVKSAGTVTFKSDTHLKLRKQMSAKRRENEEAKKTAKRRIQMLEQQKRYLHKKQTFDQWLATKRRQRLEQEETSDSDQSDDDDDNWTNDERVTDTRTIKQILENNSETFVNWLRELESRNVSFSNPKSAISLHKRKTRALKGLIGISCKSRDDYIDDENKPSPADPSQYMHSYQDWKKKKLEEKREKLASAKSSKPKYGVKTKEDNPPSQTMTKNEAKRCLDAMRNEVLAEAVSFEDWMSYQEQRKKLNGVLSESKENVDKSGGNLRSRSQSAKCSGSKNNKIISFEKWKQNLEAQEAKQKIAQLRMRREREEEKRWREKDRASSAISHQAWIKKKMDSEKEEKEKMQIVNKGRDMEPRPGSGDNDRGFDVWLNKKHEKQMQIGDESIKREQQLLKEANARKESL